MESFYRKYERVFGYKPSALDLREMERFVTQLGIKENDALPGDVAHLLQGGCDFIPVLMFSVHQFDHAGHNVVHLCQTIEAGLLTAGNVTFESLGNGAAC